MPEEDACAVILHPSQFPTCNEVVLAVNHKNVPAQRLYERVGFQDTGRRRMGPIGEQWVMNITLW